MSLKNNNLKLMCFFQLVVLFLGCLSECSIIGNLFSRHADYAFFVAGHAYGKPGIFNGGLHLPFKEKFNLLRNDPELQFGILTGDIVYKSSVKAWDKVDVDINALGKKVYFTPGNHDVGNRALYESRYGRTYNSFVYESDLFILLDPNIDSCNISGEQLIFLKRTLQENSEIVNNIFVFFHQVLWWSPDNIYKNFKINSTEGRRETINFWDEVEPLFSSLPNPVYMFAGDVGAIPKREAWMYHTYKNINLVASGMGGGTHDNFIIVHVHENKDVSYELIFLGEGETNALCDLENYILK